MKTLQDIVCEYIVINDKSTEGLTDDMKRYLEDWKIDTLWNLLNQNLEDDIPENYDFECNSIIPIEYLLSKYGPKDKILKFILEGNHELTMNIVLKYQELMTEQEWRRDAISRHRNITMEDIEKNPNFPWRWGQRGISENPNVTTEMILKHPNETWDFYYIGSQKNITMKDVEDHPELPWNLESVKCNPNLNKDFFLKHLRDFKYLFNFGNTDFITMKMIEDNIDLDWDFRTISNFPQLTIDFVRKYKDKDWNWELVTKNNGISMKDIENNPDLNWNKRWIAKRRGLPLEDTDYEIRSIVRLGKITLKEVIEKYSEHLNLYVGNENTSIEEIKYILDNYEIRDCFFQASFRKDMDLDFIFKRKEKNWHWDEIMTYRRIELKHLILHPDLIKYLVYNIDD